MRRRSMCGRSSKMRSISSSISRCWPVTQVMTLNRSGSFSSALMTGAILIASGRVPNTTRIFLDASADIASRLLPDGRTDGGGDSRPEARVLPDVVPVLAKPADRVLDPVLEASGRLVADQLPGAVDRRQQPVLRVPLPLGDELDARLVSHRVVDHLGQGPDPDLAFRREIHRLANGGVVVPGTQETIDEIADVAEIARRVGVAGDQERAPEHRPVDEVGDYVAVLPRNLAWSIGVEEAGLDDLHAVVMREEIRVQLAEHLGDLVRRREIH